MPSAAGAAPEPGMKELSPVPAPARQQVAGGAAEAHQTGTPVPEAQFVPEAQHSPVPQPIPESRAEQTMSSPEVHMQPETQPVNIPTVGRAKLPITKLSCPPNAIIRPTVRPFICVAITRQPHSTTAKWNIP